MKTLYFSLFLLFPYCYSTAQTAEQILNNDMAFSCHLFTRLDFTQSSMPNDKAKPKRIPLSTEPGFIYINIPDSLIVIHYQLLSLGNKIAERFRILAVKQKNPIILNAVTEDMEKVLIHIIPQSGTFVQFYYPETKIDYGGEEQIMAFELLELKPLGRTMKIIE